MLEDFDYILPECLIAQKAVNPRDSCRLMIVDENITGHPQTSQIPKYISHHKFSGITGFLKKNDVLVLNNTKVAKAKIIGRKSTGSPAEIIFLERISPMKWLCKIKTRNPDIGTEIYVDKYHIKVIGKKGIDTFIIKIDSEDIMRKAILPTPPYIKGKLSAEYQTVFAKKEGSLAAPTAGLHFTESLLEKIKKKGVKIAYITLHISYGTFKNIDDLENFRMDEEQYEISKKSADSINGRKGRLICVGTTSLKCLESAVASGKIKSGKSSSSLFIKPGYKFISGTDILITNFHLPKSTLLLLTCAFGGIDRIMGAYKIAVAKKYRFFSLGDAMMIYK